MSQRVLRTDSRAMDFGSDPSRLCASFGPRVNPTSTKHLDMEPWPKHPPGRSDRKALHFVPHIRKMREAGYSFEAIRIALLDVGVSVSRTTIKREAHRKPGPAPLALPAQPAQPETGAHPSAAMPAQPSPRGNAAAPTLSADPGPTAGIAPSTSAPNAQPPARRSGPTPAQPRGGYEVAGEVMQGVFAKPTARPQERP